MKYVFYYIIIVFLIIIIYSCPLDELPYYEYNPQKAGAEIIEALDLSQYISSDDYSFYIFGKTIYLAGNNKVLLISKNNFSVIGSYSYNLNSLYSNIDYYKNKGIVVCENKILLCYYLSLNQSYGKFILLESDLSGDNCKEINTNIDLIAENFNGEIGYNKLDNEFWINDISENKTIFINYYFLDSTNENYNLLSRANISNIINGYNYVIDGNYITYAKFNDPNGMYSIIKKIINFSNENEIEIKVNYLGTKSAVQDIQWDDEYLWVIIEKDSKMQLLKLGMDLIK